MHPTHTDTHCALCGSIEHRVDQRTLTHMWLWWVAGLICYIPSLILPIMTTVQFGYERESSIFSGVIDLYEHGNYVLAAIVFGASIIIPITKFVVLAWLSFVIGSNRPWQPKRLQSWYDIIHHIGRWSMIDVFVVCLLAALIQLGKITSIEPGIAIVPFAFAVICTMLATHALDPRLFWRK